VRDLAEDLNITGEGKGRYKATLSRDWEAWGPLGGYVAALAFQAAGAESPFSRPASFSCVYVGSLTFDDVELAVKPLRSGGTACCQRVEVVQNGKLVLESTIWSIRDAEGLQHDVATAPAVPRPEDIGEIDGTELVSQFPFAEKIEARFFQPVGELSDPLWQVWARFRPRALFENPWIDCARSLILIDIAAWPSAFRHHRGSDVAFIAPSLDLHVIFHDPGSQADWLLVDAIAPVAADGLIGCTAKLWSGESKLLASGMSQSLCRRFR
jgi:acyl-CoA thioesterase-2